MTQPTSVRIDFVSDIACPWCNIGFAGLREALTRLEGDIQADIHFQPFELDPNTPPEGRNAGEALMRKYGMSAEQLEANRQTIRERAAALGLTIRHAPDTRTYNTFDGHRLVHWADQTHHDQAVALKQALFDAYFDTNDNVADHEVLLSLVGHVGLDQGEARHVLESDAYVEEVRALEQRVQEAGIHSVPATIVNGRQLIAGGQPPEVFEQAIREIAAAA